MSVSQQPGESKRSKYRVLGLIGQGQFGQVFCAVHRPTGRLVALKNLEQDRFPTHKFLRELRFLLSLQHPNIVTFQSLEHTPTGRSLVMDYCEGGTLRGLMTEESRPGLSHSIKLVADVLAGLEQAHSRGIVHCDIKPENILLHVHSEGWTARISDFGIARLSQEIVYQESNTGSPAYMAPERFYGQYSVSSDLYSVGILLFELIAGHRPFSGTWAELMSAHLNAPVKFPDSIPLVWQPIIRRALQKLPARRFRSAGELLDALRAVTATEKLNLQTPLFCTVTDSLECPFQPQHQAQISQQITDLAVASGVIHAEAEQSHSAELEPRTLPFETINSFQAVGQQLRQQTYDSELLVPIQTDQPSRDAVTSEPIEHLLIRPQGCFVVTRRSIGLLSRVSARNGANRANNQPISLASVAAWTEECMTAIDPTGRWLATLPCSASTERCLKFLRLPDKPSFQLAAPVVLTQDAEEPITLLALDSRHLAIVTRASLTSPSLEAADTGTQIQVITRRGNLLGSLHLSLRLQQIILTPTPYRLLATDVDQSGTVLLIDLKPYRVRRLWVASAPQFLAVTSWGYILAEAEGRLVFLDQEGRLIGSSTSPAPITAMVPVQQHGLLLATWNGAIGSLYSLDLRLLGLDLVF